MLHFSVLKNNMSEEDLLRVLVATDNHLGFASTDPIRGDDSFDTMDEILQIGRNHNVDCVFLAGDLVSGTCPLTILVCRTN